MCGKKETRKKRKCWMMVKRAESDKVMEAKFQKVIPQHGATIRQTRGRNRNEVKGEEPTKLTGGPLEQTCTIET